MDEDLFRLIVLLFPEEDPEEILFAFHVLWNINPQFRAQVEQKKAEMEKKHHAGKNLKDQKLSPTDKPEGPVQ